MGRAITALQGRDVRRAVYLLAVGFIALWTVYCLMDLAYVATSYWGLAPGLGILPFFSEPVVEAGLWGDYLKRLTASWGSIVTGAGVVALLTRQAAVSVAEATRPEPAIETYPIIPEAERTEPRLLFIEEPRPPRHAAPERDRESARREPDLRAAEPPAPEPAGRIGPGRRAAAREMEPRVERAEGEEDRRPQPMRSSPIVRALRGRSGAAPQVRRAEPGEEPEEESRTEEPRLFSGGAREEYGFFEVEYEDGTATVERLRRAEYGGDEAQGMVLVRRRLNERAAVERRQAKPIAAIRPVSYFGFPNRR
jgi:hypothetical protein